MNNKEIEVRFNPSEIRSNSDGTLKVSGYVNKIGESSEILEKSTRKFIEKIGKGAFKKALSNRKKDIDFLAEHDSKRILASTKNESLSLIEDDKGLFMEAVITPTSWGRDTYELIKSGLYSHMSFGFKALKDDWKKAGIGLYERTISELELFEVSVVKNPAYASSVIEARGINVIKNINVPEEIRMEDSQMEEKETLEEQIGTIAEGINLILSILEENRESDEDKKDKKDETHEDRDDEKKDEDKDKKDDEDKKDSEVDEDKKDEDEDDKDKEKRSEPHPSLVELRNKLANLK